MSIEKRVSNKYNDNLERIDMYSNQSLVSIIMPAYNADMFIAESIKSVMNQTYQNWELIIINDGSIDNTGTVIKSFNDDRVKIIEQKNMGVSAARNVGLSLSKGKYLTFLDADDTFSEKSLGIRVKYLEENPDVDIVDGPIRVMDHLLEEVIRIYKPYYKGKILPRLMRIDQNVFFNVCYMIRKKSIGGVMFNENMTHSEDLLFYISVSALNDLEYGHVIDLIYNYRSGHVSAMSNMNGLENGYLQTLKFIKENHDILFRYKVYFFMRVARILFLSWLFDHSSSNKAFLSIYKVLQIAFGR
ncbi:MAG: glycosyltransferase family 2 protein [Bacteroidales bacterium]|nr:glycosyltransferase family 2 protein [Bacteroidales bacterium]